ncbi:MAG TPA: serine hydrolase [Gemmataceae bacterium]|nr:serine hydrolase [Gemmataceae bacterium]
MIATRHIACGLAAAVLLAPALTQAADPDPAAIDQLVTDTLQAWDAPGAAVVVVRGDQVLILKGYGRKQLDRPDPITPDTVFPLASCTKAFTSALIATLADEGEVRWDDPVRKHLPTFHLSDPNADALVSVRDLLSHRTGIGTHDLLWYRAAWGIDEVIERAGRLPLEYPFRGGFAYSSLMYLAAGRVAEHGGGQPWEKLVRTRLTDPLGMKGVCFTTRDIPDAQRPSGHRLGKDGKIAVMPWYEFAEANPAISLNATARDLSMWLRFHLAGGKTVDGRRLVSERNLRETRTPQTIIRMEGNARRMNPDTTQMSYAMGWVVLDHRGKLVAAHGGILDGFRLQLTLLPEEKLAFAVLTNLHETRMTQALSNTLIDRYCGLSERDWNGFFRKIVADDEAEDRAAIEARNKARNPDRKPSLTLEGFAGSYRHPAYGTAKVTAEGGKLVLEWSSFRCPLEHFEGDVFRVTEGFFDDQLVEFTLKQGQPASVRFANVLFERK